MDPSDRLSSLISLIYDAAVEPQRWEAFLKEYADAVGATTAALLHHDVRCKHGIISAAYRLDPEALRAYNDYFSAIDPWITRGASAGKVNSGDVRVGDELIPRSAFKRTEYFAGLAQPFGLTQLLGGVIRRDDCVVANLSALRSDAEGPYEARERHLLQVLMPHLQRAMHIHRRLADLQVSHNLAMDALDRIALGVIVVRGDGSVVFANRAAREILAQRDGLSSEKTGVVANVPGENRVLQTLMRSAAMTAQGRGTHPGGAMSLTRPSGKTVLPVLVTPLRGVALGFTDQPGQAAVFVSDPDRATPVDLVALQQLWGLTPAEASIASRIASGRSIEQIAGELRISHGTVRWHVKRVLTKTQTTRQAELVRVLTTGPSVIKRG